MLVHHQFSWNWRGVPGCPVASLSHRQALARAAIIEARSAVASTSTRNAHLSDARVRPVRRSDLRRATMAPREGLRSARATTPDPRRLAWALRWSPSIRARCRRRSRPTTTAASSSCRRCGSSRRCRAGRSRCSSSVASSRSSSAGTGRRAARRGPERAPTAPRRKSPGALVALSGVNAADARLLAQGRVALARARRMPARRSRLRRRASVRRHRMPVRDRLEVVELGHLPVAGLRATPAREPVRPARELLGRRRDAIAPVLQQLERVERRVPAVDEDAERQHRRAADAMLAVDENALTAVEMPRREARRRDRDARGRRRTCPASASGAERCRDGRAAARRRRPRCADRRRRGSRARGSGAPFAPAGKLPPTARWSVTQSKFGVQDAIVAPRANRM